jgi:predicted transcriptional regulator
MLSDEFPAGTARAMTSVEEIEAKRVQLGVSRTDLCRAAGVDVHTFMR